MNMKFFAFDHLPEHLQLISKPFSEMANRLDRKLKDSDEKEMALRKLLESKDCAVRAWITSD